MSFVDTMKIYDLLPVWGQNIACTLEGFRVRNNKYGERQKKYLESFMSRSTWTYEQKCEYRDQQLQKMIEHCYLHVPYYRKLFDSLVSTEQIPIFAAAIKSAKSAQTGAKGYAGFYADSTLQSTWQA